MGPPHWGVSAADRQIPTDEFKLGLSNQELKSMTSRTRQAPWQGMQAWDLNLLGIEHSKLKHAKSAHYSL